MTTSGFTDGIPGLEDRNVPTGDNHLISAACLVIPIAPAPHFAPWIGLLYTYAIKEC